MNTSLRARIDVLLAAVEAKNMAATLACFADDAIMVDPHYPTPRMVGKAAIADGLQWAFATLHALRFRPVGYFEAGDGRSAALEVATEHVLPGGQPLRFTQAFVIEAVNGRITRLQAYLPYGPHGIGSVFLALVRLRRRFTRGRSRRSGAYSDRQHG